MALDLRLLDRYQLPVAQPIFGEIRLVYDSLEDREEQVNILGKAFTIADDGRLKFTFALSGPPGEYEAAIVQIGGFSSLG